VQASLVLPIPAILPSKLMIPVNDGLAQLNTAHIGRHTFVLYPEIFAEEDECFQIALPSSHTDLRARGTVNARESMDLPRVVSDSSPLPIP
jgi:hypothetical protein